MIDNGRAVAQKLEPLIIRFMTDADTVQEVEKLYFLVHHNILGDMENGIAQPKNDAPLPAIMLST